jgi:hypothetical protein
MAMCWQSLSSTRVDDLDSAHHMMNGAFWHDVFVDRPFSHIRPYTIDYYQHYPLIGFGVHPLGFPVAEGLTFLVMRNVDFRTARIAVLLFGLVLAALYYRILQTQVGAVAGFLGVMLFLTTSVVALLYRQVMLEIPALAVGVVAVLAYQWLVARRSPSVGAVVAFAISAAWAAYTKQTVGFIYGAFLLDLVANHRDLLRNRRIWAAGALTGVLLLPLAILTAKVGQVNIAQSVGSSAQQAVYGIEGLSRWSLANWVAYPKLLLRINPLLFVGGAAGLVLCWKDRGYRKQNLLWAGWVVLWYLCFSYFGNKKDRFECLWIPGLATLTMSVLQRYGRAHKWVYGLAAVMIAVNLPAAYRAVEPGFTGVDRAVAQIEARQDAGNIGLFGSYYQVFVPFIRHMDPARQLYALRGDRIMEASKSLADALYQFRVKYIVEDQATEPAVRASIESLAASGKIALVSDTEFTADGRPRRLRIWRNEAPMAAAMAPVPMGQKLSQAVKALD